jgi:integrase/recombinase XerD
MTTITEEADLSSSLEQKIKLATEGFIDHFVNLLRKQSEHNMEIICDYILAMNTEVNPVLAHKRNQMQILCYLSEYCKQTPFIKMTRKDILGYLDTLRKPEESDPWHKWIGTYNLRRVYLLRFFKWLYHPLLEPKQRPTPEVMTNISQLKRREQSTIKPSDIWIANTDDYIFLKYCPSKRDKAYHTIARDSSCRPGEILGLRIRDLNFKTSDTNQYADILVNGKTGTRSIPLFSAVPYVKDWLDDHPQGRNPNAFLIPSFDRKHKKFGNRMKVSSLNNIYRRYKLEFFPSLLEDPKVLPEDKIKIRELLKKKWNPYIIRHSALTQKSTMLKEHTLRQHAGWSPRSNMHMKYLHYLGNESNESLLAEYGIVTAANKRGNRLLPDTLKPKQCPNCNESNIPDSKFCAKCRMVLTFDAYEETIQEQAKKDRRLEELEKSFQAQLETQRKQQELLESLWLHQQKQEQQQQEHKNQHHLPKKEDSTANPPVRVEKVMVSRRNEPGIPSTPVAETFLLVDDKGNNRDKRYDWFKNWSIEESVRGSSWRLFKEDKERKKKEE